MSIHFILPVLHPVCPPKTNQSRNVSGSFPDHKLPIFPPPVPNGSCVWPPPMPPCKYIWRVTLILIWINTVESLLQRGHHRSFCIFSQQWRWGKLRQPDGKAKRWEHKTGICRGSNSRGHPTVACFGFGKGPRQPRPLRPLRPLLCGQRVSPAGLVSHHSRWSL